MELSNKGKIDCKTQSIWQLCKQVAKRQQQQNKSTHMRQPQKQRSNSSSSGTNNNNDICAFQRHHTNSLIRYHFQFLLHKWSWKMLSQTADKPFAFILLQLIYSSHSLLAMSAFLANNYLLQYLLLLLVSMSLLLLKMLLLLLLLPFVAGCCYCGMFFLSLFEIKSKIQTFSSV